MRKKTKTVTPKAHWLQAHVRDVLPLARVMVLKGINSDDHGLLDVGEGRLKAAGLWQKHTRQNGPDGNPDAICDMFISASREGFALGVAYALSLNGGTWLKGGGR